MPKIVAPKNDPPVPGWLWAIWSAALAGYASSLVAAFSAGSRVWLVLALGAALVVSAVWFPSNRKWQLNAMALGFYIPLIALFYMRSYERHLNWGSTWAISAVAVPALVLISGVGLMLKPSVRAALPWLIGAGICGMLIGYFSGGKGGADPWKQYFVLNWGFEAAFAADFVHYLRKTIHFVFYGTLAWFSARGALAAGARIPAALAFGLAWAIPHAAFDEGRQVFVPGRSASVWDVALDTAGMLFFLGLLAWSFQRPQARSHQT